MSLGNLSFDRGSETDVSETKGAPEMSIVFEMMYQVKKLLNPHNAKSQPKIAPPSYAPTNAKGPEARTKAKVASGRPFLSMYAKNLGAWPISARASKVLDAANVDALPTDRTEINMTAFRICGTTGI